MTIKMPRQHNQRIREIQRQKKYLESIAEGVVTMGGVLLVVLCLWAAAEFAEWLGQVIHENQMLKVERQIEAGQLYVRLTVDRAAERRKEVEREAAIRIAKSTPWKKRILEAK